MSTHRADVSSFKRVAYSLLGLVAGNVVLLAFLLQSAVGLRAALVSSHMGEPARAIPQAFELFILYGISSFVGWILIGIPTALAISGATIARLAWPLWLLMGALLGPIALLLIFVLLSHDQLSRSSLAHTGIFWSFSILVAAVSFLVYGLLLRRAIYSKAG
jgi:hypothetical protein